MVYIPPQYLPLVVKAAMDTGIPLQIVAAQIQAESNWNPDAVSPAGAVGLTQFMPGTWQSYGTGDIRNGADSITAYTKYMKYLLSLEGGNLQLALADYNAGPGNTAAGMGYATSILQSSGVPPSQYQSTDNSGISNTNSAVAPYLTANTPVLSLSMLKNQYPLVAALVNSVPELTKIFQSAVSGTWSTDKFIAAVQNSNWWATHSDSARQLLALMKTDPATYNQNVDNLEASVKQMAASVGATMTTQQLQQFAVDALTGGYDQNQAVLNQKFSQYVAPVSGNHFGGQAGSYEDQLRQSMRDLGVFMPEDQLDTQIKQIIGGQQSVQGVQAQLRTQSASMYPAYAQQLNSGMNLSDIASPFIGRAQQLLEQGPGSINIDSPLIKTALQNTQDGQPTAMPMYQFEKSVRQDPRWVQTDNAQDAFMSNAHRVLVDMGFSY